MQKRKFNLKKILTTAGLKADKFILLTHRGYGKRGKIAENSMAGFKASTKLGFSGHELDVRLSKDNIVMIFHGPDLSSTTDGKGFIENKTYDEIAKFNCSHYLENSKKAIPIPTFDEYLKIFGNKLFTNVELKREWYNIRPGLEYQAVKLIRKYNCEKNVILSSFNLLSIYRLRKQFPDILVGLLIDKQRIASVWIPLAIKFLKPDSIHIHKEMASDQWINYIKKQNCGIAIWGVNDKEQFKKFVKSGVDILITDNMNLK